MAKLEGIIYNAFERYVVLSGFAPIGELAEISKKPDSYQRNSDEQHKIAIVKYLSDPNAYFPEITLACRVKDYAGLIQSIWNNKNIGATDESATYVKGLRILNEQFSIGLYRARHAYLKLDKPTEKEKLIRVDGNHRLEPFSSDISWWHQFVNQDEIKYETDGTKKKEWLNHQASLVKKTIEYKTVPFTVIMSEEKDAKNFEARIFHDINFRALPLREEHSLKIISEFKSFEELDKFGVAYPLAMELIKEVQNGLFDSIHWLKIEKDKYGKEDTDKSYFRTACLRIAQLLLSQKSKIADSLSSTKESFITIENEIAEQKKEILKQKEKIENKKKEIEQIEIANADFAHMSLYKAAQFEYEALKSELISLQNNYGQLFQQETYKTNKIKLLTDYINTCSNKNAILSALTEITNIYKDFGNNYGNISLLCALVYYSLLDKGLLFSFVDWAKRNGINKITDPDDLSKDASLNLITMFDQIHQAKKNEIFISMQFGDSQSELIYEKIVRSIELFNFRHKDINLRATPIRIDRNIEESTSSIPDGIKDAIRTCGLIIADLSSANINVYHEIGYAMGIAESNNMIPNIILLYKENTDHNKENKDVDKFIGFNLRNLSQLRFKDYDQLVEGLVKRLEKHYGV